MRRLHWHASRHVWENWYHGLVIIGFTWMTIRRKCLRSLHRALPIHTVWLMRLSEAASFNLLPIGVMFDNELSLKSEVSKLCQVAFFYIRRIRSIRDCLTQHATELLIHSLVISQLDYGNGLLYGVSDQLLDKLQRVQNVAARVVVKASRYDHITPILKTIHWLPIRYRTEYKLLLLTFKAVHHLASSYLTDLLQLYHPTRTLRSSSDALLTARSARLCNYGDRAFCVAAPKLEQSSSQYARMRICTQF